MLTSSQQQPTSWDLAGTTVTFQKAVSPEATLVRQALVDRGLETPLIENGLNRDQKLAIVRDAFTDITTALGLDLTDDSLCETPERIARMYLDEIFSGLDYSNFPKISVIENKMQVDEMVMIDAVSYTHLTPVSYTHLTLPTKA